MLTCEYCETTYDRRASTSNSKLRFCSERCRAAWRYRNGEADLRKRRENERYRRESDKNRARNLARKATPQRGLCWFCNQAPGVELHHPYGYDGKNATRVVWVCRSCHVKHHHDERKAVA